MSILRGRRGCSALCYFRTPCLTQTFWGTLACWHIHVINWMHAWSRCILLALVETKSTFRSDITSNLVTIKQTACSKCDLHVRLNMENSCLIWKTLALISQEVMYLEFKSSDCLVPYSMLLREMSISTSRGEAGGCCIIDHPQNWIMYFRQKTLLEKKTSWT